MYSVLSIGIGAFLGALFRWKISMHLNHIFPTLPFGTLVVNLLGCFLMGIAIFLTVEHTFFSYEMRLGLITGFLGSLTTFSTFSAEALNLFFKQQYFWLGLLIALHVFGAICMVIAGYALTKIILNH